MTEPAGCVYLLHFDSPVRAGSQHYLGYTGQPDPWERVQAHLDGRGASVVREAKRLNIGVEHVRTWRPGSYALEKSLKRAKNSRRFCPKCIAQYRENDRIRKRLVRVGNDRFVPGKIA